MRPVSHPILIDADIYGLRDAVRRFAAALGFGRIVQAELVIVASELATNILKYGNRGTMELRLVYDDTGRPGIEMVASDLGPPIRNFETALRDGWTDGGPIDPLLLLRRGGIGAGLGAVARLSDRLAYRREQDGNMISAQRFVSRSSCRPPRRL